MAGAMIDPCMKAESQCEVTASPCKRQIRFKLDQISHEILSFDKI